MDDYTVASSCTSAHIGRVVNDTIESQTKGDMAGCRGEMIGWTNTTKQTLTVTFDSAHAIGVPLSRSVGPNTTLMVQFVASDFQMEDYEYSAMLGTTPLGRPPELGEPDDPTIPPRPRIRVSPAKRHGSES